MVPDVTGMKFRDVFVNDFMTAVISEDGDLTVYESLYTKTEAGKFLRVEGQYDTLLAIRENFTLLMKNVHPREGEELVTSHLPEKIKNVKFLDISCGHKFCAGITEDFRPKIWRYDGALINFETDDECISVSCGTHIVCFLTINSEMIFYKENFSDEDISDELTEELKEMKLNLSVYEIACSNDGVIFTVVEDRENHIRVLGNVDYSLENPYDSSMQLYDFENDIVTNKPR